MAQAADEDLPSSPSACATAMESRDSRSDVAIARGVCRPPEDSLESANAFEIALGDILLNTYHDRARAFGAYKNAAREGSEEAKSRIAALNAPPSSQGSSDASQSDDYVPQVCNDAVHAQNRTVQQQNMTRACTVALVACMVAKFKGNDAMRDCMSKMIDEKQGKLNSKESSENIEQLLRSCMYDVPHNPSRYCTKIIGSDEATPHEKAVAYTYRALHRLMPNGVLKGAFDKATQDLELADLDRAVALDSSIGETFAFRAMIDGARLYDPDAIDKAAENYDKAVTLTFADSYFLGPVYKNRAQMHEVLFRRTHDRTQCEIAIDSANKAIARGDKSEDAYRTRATCEDDLGQAAAAKADRETAAQLSRAN